MFNIQQLETFSDWIEGLKDRETRLRLVKRLRKLELGNVGEVAPVGDGVFEMREHFGPGWQLYYVQRGRVLIVMLGGGDKASQQRDIDRAKRLARQLEKELPHD
jgi:putative addiction module killer protein